MFVFAKKNTKKTTHKKKTTKKTPHTHTQKFEKDIYELIIKMQQQNVSSYTSTDFSNGC